MLSNNTSLWCLGSVFDFFSSRNPRRLIRFLLPTFKLSLLSWKAENCAILSTISVCYVHNFDVVTHRSQVAHLTSLNPSNDWCLFFPFNIWLNFVAKLGETYSSREKKRKEKIT